MKIKVKIPQSKIDIFSDLLIEEGLEHRVKYVEGEVNAEFSIKYFGDNLVNFKMTITCLIKKLEK